MCGVWEALENCRSVDEAESVANTHNVRPIDEAHLIEAFTVSLSPNMSRESWVVHATEVVAEVGGNTGRDIGAWLIDADLATDPRMGARMATEAVAASLSAMAPRQRRRAAASFVQAMYDSTRPDALLVQRSTLPAGGFLHRGRWYLIVPAQERPPKRYYGVGTLGRRMTYLREAGQYCRVVSSPTQNGLRARR